MSDSPLRSDEEMLVMSLRADEEEKEEKEAKKSMWIHNIRQSREEEGEYKTLFPHLKRDNVKFFKYFRMSDQKFCELLAYIETDICHQDTNLSSVKLSDASDAQEIIYFKEYVVVSVLFWRVVSVLFRLTVRSHVRIHALDFSPTFRFRFGGSVPAQCTPSVSPPKHHSVHKLINSNST